MADYIDLYTLQTTVRNDIGSLYPDSVWVKAEIASLSVKSNGHCYMEFSQTQGGVLVAKARAVAWRNRYLLMDSAFASVTGSRLAAGMEILALVRISYHEIYGFSLTVEDVNPEFTLGQREKLRKETLARLTGEGLAELQKNLTLSHIPYRLAVISAETAAGWGDFSRHIRENARGYAYDLRLFPAQMQGQDAPVSMMAALASVLASGERYDAVLILRGGGSGLDLDCFDDYGLCAAVAHCPGFEGNVQPYGGASRPGRLPCGLVGHHRHLLFKGRYGRSEQRPERSHHIHRHRFPFRRKPQGARDRVHQEGCTLLLCP